MAKAPVQRGVPKWSTKSSPKSLCLLTRHPLVQFIALSIAHLSFLSTLCSGGSTRLRTASTLQWSNTSLQHVLPCLHHPLFHPAARAKLSCFQSSSRACSESEHCIGLHLRLSHASVCIRCTSHPLDCLIIFKWQKKLIKNSNIHTTI